MFVVLYKIVTFYNAACVCDDGQTGAASSHSRTLQCVSSLQSLFRCIQKITKQKQNKNKTKTKKESDGQTGAASSLKAI